MGGNSRWRPRTLAAFVGVATTVASGAAVAVFGTAGGGIAFGPCGSIDPLAATEVLACVGPSVAFVDTPLGGGSAVLLADGRLVTNAHVVDPFGEVDVVLDGRRHEAVPVQGADAMSDIAVLGPIDVDVRGVTFATERYVRSLVAGDELYLIGFPGEIDDDEPEPTIAGGILSRVRTLDRFDQTYLQTDAAIGGGQSGGALVDSSGRVLGISGLGFAEQFALALAAPDTVASIGRIDTGDVLPYQPLPAGGGERRGSVTTRADGAPATLLVPPAARDRTITVEVPDAGAAVWVDVYDLWGELLATSDDELYEAFDGSAGHLDVEFDVDGGVLLGGGDDELAPWDGTLTFDLEADTFGLIELYSDDDRRSIGYDVSVPVVATDEVETIGTLAVGDGVAGTLSLIDMLDTFHIQLDEGERIDVYVGSPNGDMAYSIRPAGDSFDEATYVDDSDEGLYGLDAHDEFEAPARGRYVIEVESYDGVLVGYLLEVGSA